MIDLNTSAKQCSICKQTLTLDNFRKVRLSSDGYASYCKHCAKSKRAKKKSNEIIKGGGNPALIAFTPRELIEELRFRGYKGTLEYTKTITL